MAIAIVQLGAPRGADEGLRIGTVRRPPRGVPRAEFARRDFYDVWLPELAPSEELVGFARRATTDREWTRFVTRYEKEMKAPGASHALDLLAALSHSTNLSVGCYCEDERHCHRSILRQLLADRGAAIAILPVHPR